MVSYSGDSRLGTIKPLATQYTESFAKLSNPVFE